MPPAMPRVTAFRPSMERALEGLAPRALILDVCGSTNDEARDLARKGAPHLTVVTTEVQTAGRGRRGRAWTSVPGEGLYASVVLRPDLPVERWTLLPLLTGVAAVRAVRHRTRVPASLKWPNDVVVNNRKLGGILVEAEIPAYAVAGIGINVAQTSFPDELEQTATSLAREDAVRLDRADLLGFLVRYLRDALADPEASLDRYRRASATIGRAVTVTREGAATVTGVALDVDARGALMLETESGVETVTAGDVVHLRPDLPRC